MSKIRLNFNPSIFLNFKFNLKKSYLKKKQSLAPILISAPGDKNLSTRSDYICAWTRSLYSTKICVLFDNLNCILMAIFCTDTNNRFVFRSFFSKLWLSCKLIISLNIAYFRCKNVLMVDFFSKIQHYTNMYNVCIFVNGLKHD